MPLGSSALNDPNSNLIGPDLVPARALSHNATRRQNDSFVDDKVSEARGKAVVIVEKLQTILPLELTESEFIAILRAIQLHKEAVANGVESDLEKVIDLLKGRTRREQILGVSPKNMANRNVVLLHFLHARESPPDMFRIMKLHGLCTPADKNSIDPKLFLWFEYIKSYRQLCDVGTNGAATSRVFFGDKELFEFLEKEINLQEFERAMASPVDALEEDRIDPHQQVVTLSEMLRDDPRTKSLAEDMQIYMVSKSETQTYVFKAWLKAGKSPESVFQLMRRKLGLARISLDDRMFGPWLTYLAMSWDSVPFETLYFRDYDRFLNLLSASGYTLHQGLNMLQSVAFHEVLKGLPSNGFMPHAGCLWIMWRIKDWMKTGMTPEKVFYNLHLTSKISFGNPNFLSGNLFIISYKLKQEFTSEQVVDLLLLGNSIDEVKNLYQSVKEYPLVGDIANGVLGYLSDKSRNMLVLPPPAVEIDNLVPYLEGNSLIPFEERFQHVVAYFRLRLKMKVDDAIDRVITLMYRGMGYDGCAAALGMLDVDSRARKSIARFFDDGTFSKKPRIPINSDF